MPRTTPREAEPIIDAKDAAFGVRRSAPPHNGELRLPQSSNAASPDRDNSTIAARARRLDVAAQELADTADRAFLNNRLIINIILIVLVKKK